MGVMRWTGAEAALDTGESLEGLSLASDDLASDIHASAEFRGHLAGVMLRKAAAQLG